MSFPTPGVSHKLRRGSGWGTRWRTPLPQISHAFSQSLRLERCPPGGPGAEGRSAAGLSFYSQTQPRVPRSRPGVSKLHAGSCVCSGKGAAAALRAASPSPPFDNGLNRALLPKAKFVICHFSDGRFPFWLLTEPRGRCRVAATPPSPSSCREGAGARECLSCLSPPVAREMVQECRA